MYKVFFNDSSITIGSEINKSLINSSNRILIYKDNSTFSEVISLVENSTTVLNLFIITDKPHEVWNKFKSNYIEIIAAGGLVQNLKEELLIIKRFGKWDLPKGKIEKNESSETAALREVEEECGLKKLKILKQLESTFHIYKSPWHKKHNNLVFKETKWYLMSYAGNELPTPQIEEEIEEAKWVSILDLQYVLDNTYRSVSELLKNNI